MNPDIAIKVQNLTKTYKLYNEPIDRLKEALHPLRKTYHKNFNALNDVSFEIKKGESVGIIGRNGSGKSTLLKIITGVLTPTSGEVFVNGKISAILELGAGFDPEMNGIENIHLNTSINGIKKEQLDKIINQIIDFSELGEFIHQPIKTYSSGMKARLAFAVAINISPDILIVDEALAVGDAAFQRKCFAKMEAIQKAGATILFVSHSEGSIINLCNNAIWLSNGQKIIEGQPKLVTGLYMKNATKKNIDKSLIIKEFEKLQKNIKEKKEEKIQSPSLLNEFYDKSLLPKSTINYDSNGAFISDIYITTLQGEKVNILIQGYEYIFRYNIRYEKSFEHVRCGMNIKTINGLVLAGGQHPFLGTKEGFNVIAGKTYTMKWHFKCLFGEGTYFTNCGTYDIKRQKQLHRIVDSYMFKVKRFKKSPSAGLVNIIIKSEIYENN